MKIKKDLNQKNKFIFDFDFSEEVVRFCNAIRAHYGPRTLMFLGRKWRFNNTDVLVILKNKYPQIEMDIDSSIDYSIARRRIEKKREVNKAIEDLKNKKTSEMEIPGLKGDIWGYQRLTVELFKLTNGKLILSDDMGSGKSVQALACVVNGNEKKTLVICPASVKYSWESEINKWTDLKGFIIKQGFELTEEVIDKNNIIVINYDVLKKYKELLYSTNWGVVIVDEFHMIKNNAA